MEDLAGDEADLRIALTDIDQRAEPGGVDHRVVVHDHHPVGAVSECVLHGDVEAPRIAQVLAVFDDLHGRKLRSDRVEGAVCRAVIHNEHVVVRVLQPREGVEPLERVDLAVPAQRRDGDSGIRSCVVAPLDIRRLRGVATAATNLLDLNRPVDA